MSCVGYRLASNPHSQVFSRSLISLIRLQSFFIFASFLSLVFAYSFIVSPFLLPVLSPLSPLLFSSLSSFTFPCSFTNTLSSPSLYFIFPFSSFFQNLSSNSTSSVAFLFHSFISQSSLHPVSFPFHPLLLILSRPPSFFFSFFPSPNSLLAHTTHAFYFPPHFPLQFPSSSLFSFFASLHPFFPFLSHLFLAYISFSTLMKEEK